VIFELVTTYIVCIGLLIVSAGVIVYGVSRLIYVMAKGELPSGGYFFYLLRGNNIFNEGKTESL